MIKIITIKTLEILVPRRIKKYLIAQIKNEEKRKRQEAVDELPYVLLEPKHINSCEIAIDRKDMLVRLGRLEVIAELGVDKGNFSRIIMDVSKPEKLHLIDVWSSERYHEGLYNDVLNRFREEINEKVVHIHREYSVKAADSFPDAYFDMVYIDTDHSYKVTADELVKYKDKIKDDGVIAGHDYTMGNWVNSFRYGVVEAVNEFCVKYDYEYIYLTIQQEEGQSFAIRKIR